MKFDKACLLKHIKLRISDLQIKHVKLQEQYQALSQDANKQVQAIALQVIDLLDMIQILPTSSPDNNQMNAIIFQKIEKRLNKILNSLNITEIIFNEGILDPNKARVVDCRKDSQNLPSTKILEVCRKGYQRGDKVVRPADVITVA